MPLLTGCSRNPNLKSFSFLLRQPAKSLHSTSTPTQQDISSLILQQQSPSKALQTFRWASRLPNFAHSQSTYKALIQKLCKFRRFEAVQAILPEIPGTFGAPPDDDIFVAIARGLGRARMVQQAVQVPEMASRLGKTPSLKIFNSVLDVLVEEDIDLGREFFRRRMAGSGVQGDGYTYAILMKGLCRTNRISEGFRLLTLMKSRGISPDTVVYNTLIHALCRKGKVGRGRSLMGEMTSPNCVTFNILISAYCGDGDFLRALVLLDQCLGRGLVPSVIAVTKLVETLCENGRGTEAAEVLDRVEKRGGSVDNVAYNALIKGFCKLRKPNIGLKILREMEQKGCLPNAATYNTLISCCFDSGSWNQALDLFREMRADGIEPDSTTYGAMVAGLCSVGKTDEGLKVLQMVEMEKIGIGPCNGILYGLYRENRLEQAHEFLAGMGRFFPRAVGRSLKILDLCKVGEVWEAKKVYDQMVAEGDFPSALVYGCLIDSLCNGGDDVLGAFQLLNEMVVRGFFPTPPTFNALIRAFCREGRVEGAIMLVEEVVRRGAITDTGSYLPLIDSLCRRGEFSRALSLHFQMLERNVVPDHLVWNSLLLCLLNLETEWMQSKHWLCLNNLLDCLCGN